MFGISWSTKQWPKKGDPSSDHLGGNFRRHAPFLLIFNLFLEVNKVPIFISVLESFRCGGNIMNKDLGQKNPSQDHDGVLKQEDPLVGSWKILLEMEDASWTGGRIISFLISFLKIWIALEVVSSAFKPLNHGHLFNHGCFSTFSNL